MTVWVAYADGGSGIGLITGDEYQGNVVAQE
jgi:hypothetical protein